LKRSTIGEGAGWKWLLKAVISSANDFSPGLEGATRLLRRAYVEAPTEDKKIARFFVASVISFASKKKTQTLLVDLPVFL